MLPPPPPVDDPSPRPDPFDPAERRTYSDGPLALAFMYLFGRKMSQQLGGAMPTNGESLASWAGFVNISAQIMLGRSSRQQQETVAGVLGSLMPPGIPERFRAWFPLSKPSLEINAWITTVFFAWLVGPSVVTEERVRLPGSDVAVPMRSGVKIEKCRYLEASGCAGMCVNMCKLPTQRFFTEDLGLPLTMTPNFEDLSCQMVFGAPPPPTIADDVAHDASCFSSCSTAAALGRGGERGPCPKLDSYRGKAAPA